MKKIIFLFAFFYSISFCQGWNSTVTITGITEPNLEIMDLFTNVSGNHIIIKRTNGNIIYYNVNSSGTVDVNKTTTLESNGDFPNIIGSGSKIFALYKTGNYIKMKYSTNGGANWTYNSTLDRYIGSNLCNGVDAVYEKDYGVHLVWAAENSYPNFETYYYRLNTSDQWVEYKNVTDDTEGWVGGNPHVIYSPNRVHVGFNTDYYDESWTPGNAKTRDRYNGTWQATQNVVSGSEQSVDEKIIVRGSSLFNFYAQYNNQGGFITNDLDYRTRSVSGTTWSSATELATVISNTFGNAFNVCKTYNDNIHLVSDGGNFGGQNYSLTYVLYNGSNWSPFSLDGTPYYATPIGLSSVSNDVFVTWKHNGDNYLRYKQYDAAPLTPTNFTGTVYNNRPKIMWTANSEPDLSCYEIWRQFLYDPKNPGTWSVLTTTTQTNFVDNDVYIGNGSMGDVKYRIMAKDINNHYSNWTGIVSFDFEGLQKQKITYTNEKFDFILKQNYPNPFNPTTKISYQLAEDAKVQIKVYDMLGTEIAELVNEMKTAGYYEATFDGSGLSSGIYIYRITATNGERILFSKSKQMMLIK